MRRTMFVVVLILTASLVASADTIGLDGATFDPLLTSKVAGDSLVTPPGGSLSGVARLIITTPGGLFGCSGSLLTGGTNILTAAHCVTGSTGAITATSVSASFGAGTVGPFVSSTVTVAPGWDGDFTHGSDLAIVTLAAPVPGVAQYGLFTGGIGAGIGHELAVAGYGIGGSGASGTGGFPFGTLRSGTNVYEAVWSISGNPYAFDFDNGNPTNDAFCFATGGALCDNRDIATDVMIAPGDSGGPSFIGGAIAGVHSFGARFGKPPDVDSTLNSSFGEAAGDTRVAAYASFLTPFVTPEPGSMMLLGTGLAGILGAWRRKRS